MNLLYSSLALSVSALSQHNESGISHQYDRCESISCWLPLGALLGRSSSNLLKIASICYRYTLQTKMYIHSYLILSTKMTTNLSLHIIDDFFASQISETFVSSLERLLVLMIENYPNVHRKIQFLCSLSILRVLLAVQPKGATFNQLLAGTGNNTDVKGCFCWTEIIDSYGHPYFSQAPWGDKQHRSEWRKCWSLTIS